MNDLLASSHVQEPRRDGNLACSLLEEGSGRYLRARHEYAEMRKVREGHETFTMLAVEAPRYDARTLNPDARFAAARASLSRLLQEQPEEGGLVPSIHQTGGPVAATTMGTAVGPARVHVTAAGPNEFVRPYLHGLPVPPLQ